jgi:quercetin dioxygenase-like cupin family protein
MSLPNPRVIITGHAEDGTSVFSSDTVVEPFSPFGPEASSFSVFDSRSSVPVSNLSPSEYAEKALPRCPPGGVIFSVSNIPPRYTVPMHRTLSLDYCIVMSGEIALELDGGETKIVRAGEVIVQRGVNHKWVNRTDEVCRIAFVLIGADKVKLADGRELDETAFKSLSTPK